MKNLKVLFGAALMLIAVAGAFASSANTRLESIFYYDATNNCVAGTVEEVCPFINDVTPDCEKLVIEITALEQVYDLRIPVSGQPGRFTCDDAYSEVQP